MDRIIIDTIIDLSKYIQEVIKGGYDEELELLPELVSSLSNLIDVFHKHF